MENSISSGCSEEYRPIEIFSNSNYKTSISFSDGCMYDAKNINNSEILRFDGVALQEKVDDTLDCLGTSQVTVK